MSGPLARWLLVSSAVIACQPRTELVIGVATDLAAPDELDRVSLTLLRADDGVSLGETVWEITGDASNPFNLPGSFGVVSDGEPVRLVATLTGFRDGDVLVTRTAILTLVPEQTLFYRMTLVGSCVARRDCPATSDCVEGVCRDRVVEPSTMPTFEAELVSAVSCNGGIRYLDTATGNSLASTPDADACPAERCIEGVCVNPPAAGEGTRTIEGSSIVTFINNVDEVEHAPTDLSTETVEVLVPQTDGSFDSIAGSGFVDGELSISDVPVGDVYVRVGTTFVVTTGSSIDLGSVRLGRADAQPVDPETTRLLVTASGLESWEPTDDLVLFATNDAYWYQDFDNPPPDGATQVVDQVLLDVSFSTPIQPEDTAVLTQYSRRTTDDGLAYTAAVATGALAPFTQVAGGDTAVSAALAPLAPETIRIAVDALDWEKMLGVTGGVAMNVAPDAELRFGGVSLTAFGQPFGRTYGQLSASPDYLVVSLPTGADLPATTFELGAPPVPEVDVAGMVYVSLTASVERALPGTAAGTRFDGGAVAFDLATSSFVSSPRLGPALDPTIDGASLFADSVVGDRPALAWREPALGTARVYFVTIHQLGISASNLTTRQQVATFVTPHTSLQIPRGLLVPGERYVVVIAATDRGNSDAPFRERPSEASATLISGVLTVEGP